VPVRSIRRLAAVPLTAAAVLGLIGAGCSRPDGPDVEADADLFCGEATARRDTILAPPMSTEAELQASLDFYRLMGELAPLAIAEEWGVLVAAMETASTIVPGDVESEQLVAMTAYATEPSAYRVKKWLLDNCGVDLPITTIAPQEATAARTLEQVTPDSTDEP
jgi:hypothetical protein